MSDPDTTSVEIVMPALDVDPDIDDAVALEDWAPAPEVSDFEVWCERTDEWALLLRRTHGLPWECRACGALDHTPRDHEGAGA